MMRKLFSALLVAALFVGFSTAAAAADHEAPPVKVNCVNYQALDNSQSGDDMVFQLPAHAAEKVNEKNKNVACRSPPVIEP